MRLAAVLGLLALPAAAPTADIVRIEQSVMIARSADAVWQRIGGYCAIAEWMAVTCDYASGDGGAGTVRRLRDATISEVMVGKTPHSYTYWQTEGPMATTGYHGTLAAEASGPALTQLTYTLVYNQAALADDATRASERKRLTDRFAALLVRMQQLVVAQ